jgi:hypothetical protein
MFLPVRKFNPEKDTNILPLPIHDGGRDDTLFRHACRVREWNKIHRLNLSYEEMLQTLNEINELLCIPPVTSSIVWRKLKSALRYLLSVE